MSKKLKFRAWHKNLKNFLYFNTPSFEYNDGIGMYLIPEKDYSNLNIELFQIYFVLKTG